MKVKAFNFLMFVWSVTIPVFAQTKAERLEQLFNHLDQKGMYNGSVAVRDQGTLIFREAYGVGSFERGTPFLPEHQTEIASVSKQFTATAIMFLHDYMQKHLCAAGFDQEAWLETHADLTHYRINRNAWAQYLKRMRETADQGTIQFLEAVDARIPRN